MQGKTAYIRHKVIGPCASGSYMHQTVLFSFVLSSRLAAPKHFGEQKNLFHYLNRRCSKIKPFWGKPIFFPDTEEGSMCPNSRINISS
jgi:hypothetical protein